MADTRTSPAMGNMGASPAIQSAKAHSSALLCFALALLTMATTAWFVVEGINATEPDSPARWAKVASGVLLLVLEASAFGLAGQWPEHSKVLRALGWAVLALEITLMSVSQISIGMTAAKSASNGAGTIEEIRAQAKESRAAADALRADAANMRKSKHEWIQQQAGERSAAAAEQSKSAAAAVASLEKHGAVTVSTPIVEIVGKGGLIGLSIALSVALSLSGIVLMHVAGSLRRRADGALPVDQQILELLYRIHGAPVAPGQTIEPAAALASFKPAGTVAPKNASSGLSYSSKAMAGAGLLAATAAPMVHAVPSPAVSGAGASEQTHIAPTGASEVTHTAPASASEQTQRPKAKRPHKSTAVAAGAKCDTGTGEHDGARYRRVKAAVQARTLAPGLRSIQQAEGGGAPTVRGYIAKMCDENVIKQRADGHGYELVKGGAA